MSAAGYQVKVYHVENKGTKEIRKFTIEQDVAANYEYLSAKIRRVFPTLLRKDIEIFWKDDDEDFLTISSNEELICAWEEHEGRSTTLKLFVKEKQGASSPQKNHEENVEHPGIICDGCDSKLKGVRYKCTKCEDFDLCSKCESKDNHPSDHEFLCIKHPRMPGSRGWYPGFSPRHFRRGHEPQMFCRRPPFGRFGMFCNPNQQRKRCGGYEKCQAPEAKKSYTKNTPPVDEKALGESVGNFAACFGLDPEVAKCYFVSFTDDLREKQKKEEEEKKNESPGTAKVDEKEKEGDISTLLATAFGVQEELVKHLMHSFISEQEDGESTPKEEAQQQEQTQEQQQQEQQEQKENEQSAVNGDQKHQDMETDEVLSSHRQEKEEGKNNVDFEVNDDNDEDDEKDETKEDEEKGEEIEQKETPKKENSTNSQDSTNNSQFKDEFENMMRNFSEQFGLPTNDGDQGNNIQGGLQSFLQGMFNLQQQPRQHQEQEKEDESRKPEDFVYVDDSKPSSSSSSLTKEDQNKLKESLDKMLAMGFDNDGGWLEQLLVSKNLSIDRVLGALNPSN